MPTFVPDPPMFDLPRGVFLWASILGFKSLLLVAVLSTVLMGPSLWRGRRWWIWILPRQWQRAAAAVDDEAARRWLARAKMVFWGIVILFTASWLLLAYQVTHRP